MDITLIIIVITVLISIRGFSNHSFLGQWMFTPFLIKNRGQYYRFLSSGFIHKDWMHLLFNMFTLYFLGTGVETYFEYIWGTSGDIYFIVLYLTAICVSSIPSFIKHHDHEFYHSLGASGGVSALVFCFILIDPITKLCLFGLLCLPGFVLGALYIIYSISMARKQMDNVNHDAHLWGALYGLVFILILKPGILGHFIDQIANFSMF